MGAEAVILGAGMSAYGQMQANTAEANAELNNAEYYRQQAELAIRSAEKEKQLFDMESQQFLGTQVNAFAKSGVEISNSVLMKIAGSKQRFSNESQSIIETGKRNANMALIKERNARANADMLRDPMYNLLNIGGPLLASAGKAGAMGG